ncbi:MAG: glycoside hydrolase N-terminal domain-containing protein, partial [Thermoguttaceae bacterium]|nr:glycoside hydrolase N-terminal domain-containing protein [Thermoguttaceae bacterium]
MKKTFFLLLLCVFSSSLFAEPIDRQAVVGRHAITSDAVDLEIPLGNGEFCFNTDRTGLQTTRGNIMAHWGWHSFPLPEGFTPADVPATGTFQQGRNQPHQGDIAYPPEKEALRTWMRENPHRADLGRIRLVRNAGNSVFQPINDAEIRNVRRRLDLWTGLHTTEFQLDGETVKVETLVRMESDCVCARVESPLIAQGKIVVSIDFPYPTIQMAAYSGEFGPSEKHMTQVVPGNSTHYAQIQR